MKINRLSFYLICESLLFSCTTPQIPNDITQILNKANKNKSELLNVIKHYAKHDNDSLKLKATYFLIKNLEGRYYLDGKFLDNYMDYAKLTLRDLNHGEYILKSFNHLYGPYSVDSTKGHYDLEQIKASQMIGNIEAAFKVWQEQPWGKDYSFQQFCEYILPFRIADEIPSYNRMDIYKKFKKIIDTARQPKNDAINACTIVNNELNREGWILTSRVEFLPHTEANKLIEYRLGACREMVDLGIYVMRSIGIPVTFDFLPQWPYRRQGHSWDVVIGKNGKAIPFLAAEDSPGTPHRPGTTRGKVYRNTFIRNQFSLANIAPPGEQIPGFLRDPYILDVTEEYAKTHNFEIEYKEPGRKFGYLSVFDNVNWKPIAWAKINNFKAQFEKVEGGIVYLPTYFNANGAFPAKEPFILDANGSVHFLKADTVNTVSSLICNRVYPIVAESYFTDMATGGKIQGANKKDFTDACTLFEFKVRALPGWNDLTIKKNKRFRYYRFLSSTQKKCNLAELQLYGASKLITGKVFNQNHKEDKLLKKAIDGDKLTAYTSGSTSSWLGLDLGTPIAIDIIRFMSKIDIPKNHLVVKGKTYVLKYWTNGDWKTINKQIATDKSLHFSRVPSNALFLLTSDESVKDMRIFTCKEGRQIWW